MNFVSFKSTQDYYFAEEAGLKSNTMRIIDYNDERFELLREGEAKYIQIKLWRAQDEDVIPEMCFIREITHYCEWNGFAIISWKHDALVTGQTQQKYNNDDDKLDVGEL